MNIIQGIQIPFLNVPLAFWDGYGVASSAREGGVRGEAMLLPCYLVTLLLCFLLTSCYDYDETMDGVHSTVTSQLAISLSDKSATRMTDAIVQEGANTNLSKFRGIRDLKLIPYETAGTIAAADQALGTAIELPLDGALPSMTSVNTIEHLNSASNSQVYQDVDIPSGTCSFLVYGEAPPTSDIPTGLNTQFVNGSLTASGWPTDANLATKPSFALEQICSTNTADATATLLASYLTEVEGAFYMTRLIGSSPYIPDEVASPHDKLLTNKAGASADVTAMLQHLYTSVLDIINRHLTSITDDSRAATQVKNAILGTSNRYATDDGNGNLTFSSDLLGYPENLHLPTGAARINWNGTAFEVVTTNQSWLNNPDLTDYIYPPSLWYYANTQIKTSGSPHEDEMTDGTTTWTGVLSEYDAGFGTVESGVASVALNDQLQYGVARFDVTLQGTASLLKDKVDNDIPVVGNNFPVTGILVCGQYNPDWQFLPVTTGTPTEYTVYDHAINGVDADGNAATMQLTADQSIVNHTLLIETETDLPVKFAIELQNNYGDFYGIDDPASANPQPMLIPKDSTFYLIGELDPTAVSSTEYDKTNGKVFKQDFTTIGEFTVSSLANACYVVPDLRISRLQLSLSANLRWQKGIVVNDHWVIDP